MKYLILATALLASFAAPEAMSQIKVGYVDSETILKQLPEAKAIETEMESLQKLYLDTVQAKENDLKSKAETFKSKYEDAQNRVKSGSISESEVNTLGEEMDKLQTELRDLSEELEGYKSKVQNSLLLKQAELFKPLKDKITKTIEDVAKTMKISFVFDKADGTLLYGDKEYDITFKVLDKLK